MHADEKAFIESLPAFSEFHEVAEPERYRPLPDGWVLAIADIVDSTGAIAEGHYKSVNMAGAGVIAAIVNALDEPSLPFIFGGDGAAVAVPPSGLAAASTALADVLRWVEEDLSLSMRAALVPLSEIRASGHDVRIARFRASEDVAYAMFSGGGNSWAEAQMKLGRFAVEPAVAGARPQLEGLSCRWNPIPSLHGEIVSIIAVPGARDDGALFRQLISDIVMLASGEERGGHPVPATGPEIGLSVEGLDAEVLAQAHTPLARIRRRLIVLGQAGLMKFLDRFGLRAGRFDPAIYRRDVARNTDFRKFDDGLKMTVDIDAGRIAAITARLEEASSQGICHYGLHRQDSALMTCIVPSPLARDHMHFVDGAAGGYARAASDLKARISASQPS